MEKLLENLDMQEKSKQAFNRISTHGTNTWGRAISGILTKLGWFDPLMGRVDHPQYFLSGVTPVGGAAPPQG